MMSLYRPPASLKKHHKDLLKTAWSIRQGYDGTKLGCSFCIKVGTFGEITVHHKDGNEGHNDPNNVAPACWDCHMKEGWMVRRRKKAEATELERENALRSLAVSQMNMDNAAWEPKQSARMRFFYQNKLYHPKTGIAKDSGTVFGIKGLASQLKDMAGFGESVTYRRYLDDDLNAGYFVFIAAEKNPDGIDKIERSDKPYPLERLGLKEAKSRSEELKAQE